MPRRPKKQEDTTQTIARMVRRLARRFKPEQIILFGSHARGEAGPDSDVDFLVDMEPGRSLLDIGELMLDLRDLLGRKVDLVTEASLYWLLRRRILREARPL